MSVRVSDVGLGIPRDQVDGAMQYGVTSNMRSHYQMHGLGYGLPMSRMYARYFQVRTSGEFCLVLV